LTQTRLDRVLADPPYYFARNYPQAFESLPGSGAFLLQSLPSGLFNCVFPVALDVKRIRFRARFARVDLAENYRASYRGAIGHIVERLRDGRPFETSIADNPETLRIVEAAYRGQGS
jgi:hypothetical protein